MSPEPEMGDRVPPECECDRPSLLMCCRSLARCAQDTGRALTCPYHRRLSKTPPEPVTRDLTTETKGADE